MTFSMEPLTFSQLVTLTMPDLRHRPDLALEAIEVCGDLAPWLLRPEVYACAGLKWIRPEIPAKPGNCWVLQVVSLGDEGELAENSIFRPAVILPLIWRRGTEHDPRLSAGGMELADLIVGYKLGAEDWALHLDLEEVPEEFRKISMKSAHWQSAWAALYAGLDLAVNGFEPVSTVFASGAWLHGLLDVAGLKQKAAVVQEWCEGKKWTLYTSNQRKLPKMAGGSVRSLELNRDRKLALRCYLADLRQKPGKEDDALFDAYYLGLVDAKQKDAFYMDTLLPFLEEKHRRLQPEFAQYCGQTLVEWACNGKERIGLSVRLLQPRRVILLASEDYEQEKDVTERFLRKNFPKVEIVADVPNVDLQEDYRYPDVAQYLSRRLEAYVGEPMVLDVTISDNRKSLAMMDFRDRHLEAKHQLLYWSSRCDEAGNLLPTTFWAEFL